MTPERWHQVQTLFHQALDLPTAQRPAFLADACPGDDAVRDEVEALLAADAETEAVPILEASREDLATLLTDPEASPPGSEHIGPYRLLEEIGRGGMGTVYRAERDDEAFEQQVAIKVVKRGMDTDEILRRFRYERQILAGLHHPRIAQLYDGGRTPDGRPYLVMEYVDGQAIDRYCDAKILPVDDRLRLFTTVCDAVRHAHRNLVIHRDLKPSNILVTEEGQVKLLDFGIAKLLDEKAAGLSVPLTQTGVRVMTPEYAAPEQVRGEAITTATDVYALGMVLYELLTGRRPYIVANKSTSSVEQAVLAQEPERPSTAVTKTTERTAPDGTTAMLTPEAVGASRATSVARLQKQLRGDLDTILLKALRKEPERRYASAEAFLEDLKRYLAGLPVQARPDTMGYRLGKFVRRNRMAMAAACLIGISLVGGLSAALWQAAQARRERDVAREVSRFLEDLFDASDPFLAVETQRADTLRLRDFLDRSAERIQRELRTEPAVQTQMLHVVSRVYRNLGLFDQAEPLAREALALRRTVHGTAHRDLAASLHTLAGIVHDKGDYDAAESLFREALAMRRALLGTTDLEVAETLGALGALLRDQGAFEEAERLHQEALSIQRTLLGENHLDVATTLLQLGRLFQDQADLDAAEPYYRNALALHRTLLDEDHPQLAQSVENMAVFLKEKGDLVAAEPLMREALALRHKTLGENHPHTVSTTYELAGLLRDKGELEQAVSLFRQVIELDRRQLGATHHYVGLDLFELGITFSRLEAYDDAEHAYREALTILRDALPEGHPHISQALTGLGYTYVKQSKPEQGEPFLREALAIRLDKMGADAWRTGVSKSTLGECLMLQGRYDEAAPLLLEGYTTLRDNEGPTRAALERLVAYYEQVAQPEETATYRALLADATR